MNTNGFSSIKRLSRDVQFLQASGLDRFNWFSELPLCSLQINIFPHPDRHPDAPALLAQVCLFRRAARRASMALSFFRRHFPAIRYGRRASSAFISRTCLSSFAASAWPHLGFTGHGPKTCRVSRVHSDATGALLVDLLLRHTVCPQANYFFVFGQDVDIGILTCSGAGCPCRFCMRCRRWSFVGYVALICLLFSAGSAPRPGDRHKTA